MANVTAINLASYGELLHDEFPSPRPPVPGGAPANLSIHAAALGARASLISSVGCDPAGLTLRRFVHNRGVNILPVQQHPFRPSGRVSVSLNAQGTPSYLIHEDMAWDCIRLDTAAIDAACHASVFCFGTLAQRHSISRRTLERLLSLLPSTTLRLLDVNLRQNFWSAPVLESSFRNADLVKISNEELPAVSHVLQLPVQPESFARALLQRYPLKCVAITLGSEGSLLITPEQTHHQPGIPTQVVDTVGAGDVFTAALAVGWSQGRSPAWINENGNRLAAYVCSREGATPQLPDDAIGLWSQAPQCTARCRPQAR